MACTTILVGKNVSYDGSTLVARNEDSPSGEYTPKKFIVVHPDDQPKTYQSVISKVKIPLPENPLRYTAMPDGLSDKGIWAACGINEENIAMTATETLTSNERVLGADPLVKYQKASKDHAEIIGGIGEEDMVTLVLPYIHSAREGVERLGQLLTEYGTYEMNGIAFQDVHEIWWLETIGGHHWIAKRVPDDAYVVMPNQLGIDAFDLDDAFGAQENHLCSSDLREFIIDNHLDLSLNGQLNPRDAFGSHSDSDHIYNTPRAWIIQKFFNPTSSTWTGCHADYSPISDNIPWSRQPERKITIEDIKYTLSHHYQGTPYDPYAKGNTSSPYRPIGINRNNFLGVTQIRPYKDEAIQSIEWLALGSNVFNALIPFYTNIEKTPDYLANISQRVTADNFYWANRIIAALTDAHFDACIPEIGRYQEKLQARGHALITKTDQVYQEKPLVGNALIKLLEEANQSMADMAQADTDQLLARILYLASNGMKNGFSLSDN